MGNAIGQVLRARLNGPVFVIGLLLVLLTARQWRGRPQPGHEVETPKWMGSVERFSPGKAAGAGVVLSGANPKNTLLAIGAAVAIAQTGTGGADQAMSYAVFCLKKKNLAPTHTGLRAPVER